jgi:hypothetical protein
MDTSDSTDPLQVITHRLTLSLSASERIQALTGADVERGAGYRGAGRDPVVELGRRDFRGTGPVRTTITDPFRPHR